MESTLEYLNYVTITVEAYTELLTRAVKAECKNEEWERKYYDLYGQKSALEKQLAEKEPAP